MLGVFLTVSTLHDVYRVNQQAKVFRKEGKLAIANVVSVSRGRRGQEPTITYAFDVNGKTFSNTEKADRDTFYLYANGGRVKVMFLPHDPWVSTYDLPFLENAAQSPTSSGHWLMAGFGVAFIGLGISRLLEGVVQASDGKPGPQESS